MKLMPKTAVYALLKTIADDPTIKPDALLAMHPRITKSRLGEIMHDYIISHDGKRWGLLRTLRDRIDILEGRKRAAADGCLAAPRDYNVLEAPPMGDSPICAIGRRLKAHREQFPSLHYEKKS